MKRIAIIPARGGSKRIPRKNIKDFLGKPVIVYSIETAIKSELFDEVMVSTDDEEIAAVARQYGANVPFMRSAKYADDFAGTGDVCFEVLQMYKEKMNKTFELACCIYATNPLLKIENLERGLTLLEKNDFDAVAALGQFEAPVLRSYTISNSGEIKMQFPEYEEFRSQDLVDAFYDTGQFYWFYSKNFMTLQNKNVFGHRRGGVLLDPIEVQDIDEASDWEIAEFKYLFNKRRQSENK